MQVVRTIDWVLVLIALLAFAITNWAPVSVKIWEGLILETKIPALVIVAFLLGLVPMWLVHRGVRWSLERRIGGLENAMRTASAAIAAPLTSRDPGDTEEPAPDTVPPANEAQ